MVTVIKEITMKYQLWSTDEYGQSSIIETSTNVENLIKRAKQEVQEENVNNAFTADEKKKNWSCCFVELVNDDEELIEDAVYSGKNNKGVHSVLSLEEPPSLLDLSAADCQIHVYLGNLDREEWYAADERGKTIDDINHRLLQDKVFYFIKKVGR